MLFFFTLSGFLITYLLVWDQLNSGRVHLKKFFIRRSLRIWPLFYLMVILVFLLPYDFKSAIGLHMVGGGYDLDYRFSFTFLENYKMLLTDLPAKTTPLNVFWSLCIEEHFYLIWMLACFLFKGKSLRNFLIISIGFGLLSRLVEDAIWHNTHITTTDVFTNIDYFAIGGLLGYYVGKDYNKVSMWVESIPKAVKSLFILVVVLLVVFQDVILPNSGWIAFIRPTIIAAFFTLLIAVFLPKNSTLAIRNSFLAYLGRISYGLYVYHIIVIHICLQYCFDHHILLQNGLNLFLFTTLTLALTTALSALSYRYFELPFLRLREGITA